MNLKQLKHVVALSDTLNFHRAAERVFLTQSALSRSIANFESDIGLVIFDRSNGQVAVTSVGQQVLHRARKLLADSHNFLQDVRHLKEGISGLVSFGMGPFLAATVIPSALKKYHLAHPGISLNMNINRWDYLRNLLENEAIEFFIADIRQIPDDQNLNITLLGNPSIGFYCRRGHPLHKQNSDAPINAQELLEFPMASVGIPPVVKQEIKHELNLAESADLKIDIQCDDLLLLKNLLPGTDIILLCAKAMMAFPSIQEEIVHLNVPMANNKFGTWGLVTIKSKELTPAAQILAQLLCTHIVEATNEF